MAVHLVYSESGWLACQTVCTERDVIVLMGDATYLPVTGAQVKVLQTDLETRGLAPRDDAIDYAGLVDLVAQHNPCASWP